MRLSVLPVAPPAALLQVDRDLRVTAATGPIETWFGRTADDVVGRGIDELVRAEHLPALAGHLRAVLAGEPLLLEAVGGAAPPTVGEIEILPVRGADGAVHAALMCCRDVSEARATDREARAERERLRAIIENTNAAVFVKDLDGHYLLVNSEVERIAGVDRERLVHLTDYDMFPAPRADALRVADLSTLDNSEPLHVEEEVTWRDGSTHVYLSVKFALRDEQGRPYATCGIATDITERKRGEDALRRNEELFSLAFGGAPIGMALSEILPDGSPKLLRVNQVQCEMIGREPAEVLQLDPYAAVPPEEWAMLAAAVADLASGGDRRTRVEHSVVRSDGTRRWVSHSMAVLADATTGRRLLVSHVEDMTERRQTELRLSHLAFHDPLTGLPNRALLRERIEQSLHTLRRTSGLIAVLFSDLDRFKVINDSLGHDVGDRLLVEVAARFSATLRPGDTLARFGGDEFVVLAEGLPGEHTVHDLAERLRQSLRTPFRVGHRDITLHASIGVALGVSADQRPEQLLQDADVAMYLAKHRGGDRYELFDATLRTTVMDRLELEHDLRNAIARDQLAIVYQPIVRLRDGAVVAAEALVRWPHPTRGTLLPEAFVPLAEEIGLVGPIDRFVLDRACAKAAAWHAALGDAAPMLRVNLSARGLTDPDLTDYVLACLDRTGLPPALLCFEITETTLVTDPAAAAAVLGRLRDHGIKIAVDDFGTRYASLSYLIRFPLDMVKIDRSFVAGVDTEHEHAAVVAAIIDLAGALDLDVTAEGVETEAQRAALDRLGCDHGQGYLWARPGPSQQMDRMLAARR